MNSTQNVNHTLHTTPSFRGLSTLGLGGATRSMRSRLAAGILLLSAFGLPAAAHAQEGGSVEGSVHDAETGLPLVGAEVLVRELGIEARTSAEGVFLLEGLPPGTHAILVRMSGFADESRSVAVAAGYVVGVQVELGRTTVQLEGLVVTGTAFSDAPVEAPYSVAVAGRRTMQEQGSPTAVDFFRNLASSAGVLGDRQGWYSTRPATAVSEASASVNLRGIGPSRTLVLLNGRRQVYVPARLAGGRFVDVNVFPAVALDRIEVVKEGASAVYGSDAVAGVVNFLTRKDFEGAEMSASHEWFRGSGESQVGGIWGKRLGEGAHAVLSAEVALSQVLAPESRDWALRGFEGAGAWSYTGNPGAFLFPRLTGDESKEEFSAALQDAQFGGWGGVFVDPQCEAFGGHVEGETCRFRYQPWDNLIQESRHVRVFGELNGELSTGTRYHAEALWASASTPGWITTPSYPPISPYNGAQILEPGHPGRQEFCRVHGASAGFASTESCLKDDWYFYGRLVGNTGPGRVLDRGTGTQRLSASLTRDLGEPGSALESLEAAVGYSRSAGNWNLPAEYAYRKFLAFRGFGGPECGVDVVVDPESPSGMALGALNGAAPGEGACMYYNPFSNAGQRSAQPGAQYVDQDNPDYVSALANSTELLDWINEEVNLENAANLMVGDLMARGSMPAGLGRYALGYQFRRVAVSADPNEPGDLSINPCPVLGDKTCLEKAGAFTFTAGHYAYSDHQTVHRLFAETQVDLGDRIHAQIAANFESHGTVSSFDPKAAVRMEVTPELALRGSVQTTMRTPSVDDLNEDVSTSLEYVAEAGIYKALDTKGDSKLVSERALTYNFGATVRLPRLRATVDYWSYDFSDVIDVLPAGGVTALYAAGGDSRAAVQDLVKCPDGWGTGTCDVSALERIEVSYVNWPGIELSGLDWHLSARFPVGGGADGARQRTSVISLGTSGTYLEEFFVKPLDVPGSDVVIFDSLSAIGQLNWYNPIAPPLPRMKSRFSLGYHIGDYSAVGYWNMVSGYKNEVFKDDPKEEIGGSVTFDLSMMRRSPSGMDIAVSILNVLDSPPPLVYWEQSYDGFTHSPKGQRIKMTLTWRPEG